MNFKGYLSINFLSFRTRTSFDILLSFGGFFVFVLLLHEEITTYFWVFWNLMVTFPLLIEFLVFLFTHLFTLKILCLFTIEFENASLQWKKEFCTFCCFCLNKYLNKSLFRKCKINTKILYKYMRNHFFENKQMLYASLLKIAQWTIFHKLYLYS